MTYCTKKNKHSVY